MPILRPIYEYFFPNQKICLAECCWRDVANWKIDAETSSIFRNGLLVLARTTVANVSAMSDYKIASVDVTSQSQFSTVKMSWLKVGKITSSSSWSRRMRGCFGVDAASPNRGFDEWRNRLKPLPDGAEIFLEIQYFKLKFVKNPNKKAHRDKS